MTDVLHHSLESNLSDHTKIFHKTKFVRCTGHSLQCVSVAWNATGDRLASGSTDRSILLWNTLGNKSGSVVRKHEDEVNRVQWAPSDTHSFASCSKDKTLRLWDERQSDQVAVVALRRGSSKTGVAMSGESLAWHSNGVEIAVVLTNQDLSSEIQIVDVRTNTVRRHAVLKKVLTDLAWSSIHREMLFATAEDGCVMILNGSNLDTSSAYILEAHSGIVQTIDVDATGRRFATGSSDSIINVWNMRDITCDRSVNNSESSVRCARFSSDGKFLASATDKRIWINHCETGKVVGQLPLSNDEKKVGDVPQGMWCLAWHPKRYTLAFGGERAFLGMKNCEHLSC